MNSDETKPIFGEEWFVHRMAHGFGRAMHGTAEQRATAENALFNQMMLYLLDRQRNGHLPAEPFSFYGFCQRSLPKSRSQILQDLWVLYMSGEKRNGYFVEFGACDGEILSNTLLLEEQYGWTGILAEPNPVWHKRLNERRNCQISHKCVHWTTGEHVGFEMTDERPELSRLEGVVPDDVHERNGNRSVKTTIDVETISLNDLLDSHDAPDMIDYLSIDTEGSEYEILEAFDFKKRRIRFVTVEHAGETAKRERIRALMLQNGYAHWHPELSRWDDWYVAL